MNSLSPARSQEGDPDSGNPADEHPYSDAQVAEGLVFASGALSIDDDGLAVTGRREALDAALVMTQRRLASVGADLADVVRLTYFVTDLSLRTEANEQYQEVFAEPRPARTFLEISRLPYGATVEIEAIARTRPDGC